MEFDQRRCERCDFPYTIEYTLKNAIADELFEGYGVDVGSYGLGLITSNPLNEGQEIVIKTALVALPQLQEAVVRWVKNFDDYSYKAGLEFLQRRH